jgi:hypothetical protein
VPHLGGLAVTCIIYALTSYAISIFTEENIQLMAASLGVSDDDVRSEYAKWLMRYDKAADETRYPTFKKNIILLAQSNRDHGRNFSLNEYGDSTEGTCRTWGVWLLLVSSIR